MVAPQDDPRDEQLYELTALGERLFGVGLDLGDTLVQRHEPGVGAGCELLLSPSLGEV